MLTRFRRFHRDARLLLATTLVTGAALSLYWIDFNLYLASLGHSTATIGLVATIASMAGALVAFPASAASDRLGRRAIMAGGITVAILAIGGLLLFEALPLIILSAVFWSVGQSPKSTETSGDIALQGGVHPITLTFFQAYGPMALELYVEGPGMPRRRVDGTMLLRDRTPAVDASGRAPRSPSRGR